MFDTSYLTYGGIAGTYIHLKQNIMNYWVLLSLTFFGSGSRLGSSFKISH